MTEYKIPEGYTRYDPASNRKDAIPVGVQLEVIFEPKPSEKHFCTATSMYVPRRDGGGNPWTSSAGTFMIPDRKVLAWRVPGRELLIESMTVSAADREVYDRAIDGLARESIDRAFGGEFDDKPGNVAYVAKLFGVAEAKVIEDYTARKTEILA